MKHLLDNHENSNSMRIIKSCAMKRSIEFGRKSLETDTTFLEYLIAEKYTAGQKIVVNYGQGSHLEI